MTMPRDKVAVKGYKQTLIGFLETFSTKTTSRGCRCLYSPSCREEVFSETQGYEKSRGLIQPWLKVLKNQRGYPYVNPMGIAANIIT
jgi:hypothetical protein